jgi:hypothetical protein
MFCLLAILPLSRVLHLRDQWVTFPWAGARRALGLAVMIVFVSPR